MKRNLLLVILLVSSFLAKAQIFDIVVQKGHLSEVNNLVFHDNNRLLASADNRNDVVIWDVMQGKEITRVKDTFQVTAMDFLESEHIIITGNKRGQLKYFNIASNELEYTVEFGMPIYKIVHFGDQVLVISDNLYLINFEEQQSHLLYHGRFEDLVFNEDKYTFVGYNYGRDLFELDTTFSQIRFGKLRMGKEKLIKVKSDMDALVRDSVISLQPKDGSFYFLRDKKLIKCKLFDGAVEYQRQVKGYGTCIDVDKKNGNVVLGTRDGTVSIRDKNGREINSSNVQSNKINAIKYSKDFRYFAAASDDHSVAIYSAIDGKVIHALHNNALPIHAMDYDKQNKRLFIAQDQGVSKVLNFHSSLDIPELIHHEDHVGVVSDILYNGPQYITSGFDGNLMVYNSQDHQLSTSLKPKNQITDYDDQFIYSIEKSKIGDQMLVIRANRDGDDITQEAYILNPTKPSFSDAKKVALNRIPKNFRYEGSNFYYISKFNHETWGTKENFNFLGTDEVMITKDNSMGIFEYKGDSLVLDENYMEFESDITGTIYASKTKFFLGKGKSVYGVSKENDGDFRKMDSHFDDITDFVASDDFLFSSSLDGTIKIWDLLAEELVATVVPFTNESLLIYTPDMYYLSINGAHKNVGFKLNADFISFENFDLKLNRPDIVLKRLKLYDQSTIDFLKKVYDKRLRNMDFDPEKLRGNIDIPELKIKNLSEIPFVTNEGTISIDVTSTSKSALDRYDIYVNDIPLYGSNGLRVDHLAKKEDAKHFNIALTPGKNEIKISSTNEDGNESIRRTFEIFYEKPEEQRDLYIVSIGVNNFSNPDFNLQYAVKDAQDVSNYFSTLAFNQIHTYQLLNEDFNKAKLNEIKDELKKSKPNDQVVLFIASHGVIDADFDYYFGTSNIDFNNPKASGISKTTLYSIFDSIPCRNKISFIDACHSGEIDKELIALSEEVAHDEDLVFRAAGKSISYQNQTAAKISELEIRLFENLKSGNGSTVIASSSGIQLSLELKEMANGLFTNSLLETLGATENQEVIQLFDKLYQRIEEKSNGLQTPSMNSLNTKSSYKLK